MQGFRECLARLFLMSLPLLCPLCLSTGCSQEQRDEIKKSVSSATDQVQKKVEETGIVEAIKKPLARGEFALTVDGSVGTKSANCRILDLGGRGNIVQMRSYFDTKNETFPSIFFQGPVEATDVSRLVGQSVQGTMFIQATANGTIWSTPLGQSVTITFSSVDGNEILGKVVEGTLVNDQGDSKPCQGTFRASFSEPTKSAALNGGTLR